MPKVGVAAMRKQALIRAAIAEIGRTGSLDVTVSQIAGRAGVSSALAHHYFGSKDQIFLAFHAASSAGVRRQRPPRLANADGPRAPHPRDHRRKFRATAVRPRRGRPWLAFYVQAQTSREAARLLRVYARTAAQQSRLQFAPADQRRGSEADRAGPRLDDRRLLHPLRAAGQRSRSAEAKRLVADYLDMSLECEMAGLARGVAKAGAGG